jgi:hypothetical protein
MARGMSRWRQDGHKEPASDARQRGEEASKGSTTMSDLIYIGLTVLVFAVLGLLVWGVERFER